MTAKEFLRRARSVDRRVDEAQERVQRLRARLESGRMSSVTGMPRGGGSVRTTWKARVTDPKKVPAYFDGYELREINMTMLNGLARQYEGRLDIPGVKFYRDETLSVRA